MEWKCWFRYYKSKSIFYAKAINQKNSTNSEVVQNNNNLILSDTAKVHSNPQLEIYNNDVKCSHGSTTGTLDDEILFYMRSRGIKKSESATVTSRMLGVFRTDARTRAEFLNFVTK